MPGASGAEGWGAMQLPLQAVGQTKAQHCAEGQGGYKTLCCTT